MIDTIASVLSSCALRGWLPAAFAEPFMARALVAVGLCAPLFGPLSVVVTARRLAFFSAAIAQAAMAGVAVGLWLGEPVDAPWAGLTSTSVLAAIWLVWLRRRARLPTDTITGVFLALSLAVGLCALVVVTRRFNVHQVEGVLLGSPLTVTTSDLAVLAIAAVVVVATLARIGNALLLDAVDPALARAAGHRVVVAEYIFVAVLAFAVVAALRVVGALLVEALVILPAASARLLVRGAAATTALATLLVLVAGSLGLLVSSVSPAPTGAAIVLVLGACFAIALPFRRG